MSCKSPSVMVVDDEAVMVMLIKLRLKAAGFDVCATASSKQEAIHKALENSPDFVIMDIRLTESGDGIEAAQEILKSIKTHLIFISGYSEGDIYHRAMELNPDGYIVKPFDISELVSVMRNKK
ncbi:sensory transduction regulatory protein [Chitinispirillum alkaliphilum]|nr:sensory transduction regulatory protein [Chitinispirillum alkaliphilum]